MKVTALAPWFGSKRTMAEKIIDTLGPHKSYWEPFCGSMAVLLSKPSCRLETVNDLHGDLINLARVVRDAAASVELYRRARLVFCSDDELNLADDVIRNSEAGDGVCVDRALAYLVTSWMGRNGECGLAHKERAKSLCVRWSNNGGGPGTRWHSAVRSIAAWHRRLCQVIVLRRDGLEVLEKIVDEAGAAIYLDPPYLIKSDRYVHDFESADHGRLATIASKFHKARVVVSYYDHPRLSELYPGWQKIDCSRSKNLANASKPNGQKKIAPEVLLVNAEPSELRQADLFAEAT